MSEMHQPAALSTCPSCEWPLDTGDLYCGACGYDLSAAPVSPDDRPTLVINGLPRTAPEPPAAPPAAPPDGPDAWPAAPDAARGARGDIAASETQDADDVRVRESADARDGHAGRDEAAEPDDYPLPAPDPRAGAPAAPAAEPAAETKVCVACRAGSVAPDGYCENCGHAQPRERDHMERELDAVAAVSDRGLRHHRNEDAFAISTAALPDGSPAVVAIVCDGVSSATRPDEASAAAARAADASLRAALPRGTHPQQAMHDAIVSAADAVNALADEPAAAREHHPHQNAPACTLVGAVVTGGLLVVGWVGDSRVYWVPVDRTGPAVRLTEDDSWAAQMVAAGLMNEAEAYADERAHAITGWLGADAYELEPHTASFKPDRAGVVVVCTDGLWNYAEAAEEMAAAVPADAAERPLHSARVLVGHALDGGGHDNVTVAVLPFPAASRGAGSA
ncbi:protein phosphatase 2C domain-containing protein [Streptomyces sp. YIM 121038]|uniref:protein phosphatase 2C domain-containing protein n=1 Tax=Streptomyces sp. YIM 121038 TaxID=2136401 RepID=UPI0011103951|nr:protein phosphatase 2C domain-containing protein [Streptomyces sp. YIM 121038]